MIDILFSCISISINFILTFLFTCFFLITTCIFIYFIFLFSSFPWFASLYYANTIIFILFLCEFVLLFLSSFETTPSFNEFSSWRWILWRLSSLTKYLRMYYSHLFSMLLSWVAELISGNPSRFGGLTIPRNHISFLVWECALLLY